MVSNLTIFIIIIVVIVCIIGSLFKYQITRGVGINLDIFKHIFDKMVPHGYLQYYLT